jgi:hypothetical protein
MTDEFVTCPVCGKHGRLLTKAGLFRKHDDPAKTAALRDGGDPFGHQPCAAWGCTPEQAKKTFSLRLSY